MNPSEEVQRILAKLESGTITREQIEENAEGYCQETSPFTTLSGNVYREALAFLQQE